VFTPSASKFILSLSCFDACRLSLIIVFLPHSSWLHYNQEVASARGAVLHKLRDTLTHYAEAGLVDFYWDDSWDRTSSDSTATAVIGTTAGATTIVDTDRLNTNLSLAALCLLKQEVGGVFAGIDVRSEAVQRALHSRPPCRWEVHRTNIVTSEGKPVSVEAVLDVGHNPAAMGALTRRINAEYNGRPVRYSTILSHCKVPS
jgi:folylpolyglutamate synthase/dihydropteroate synthase